MKSQRTRLGLRGLASLLLLATTVGLLFIGCVQVPAGSGAASAQEPNDAIDLKPPRRRPIGPPELPDEVGIRIDPSRRRPVRPAEEVGARMRRPARPHNCLAVFPELVTATAQELGIVEFEFLTLRYAEELKRGEAAIEVLTASGRKEVKLLFCTRRYLATELVSYRADGTKLTAAELHAELTGGKVVLATFHGAKPPAEFFLALSGETLVVEIPFEQLITISHQLVARNVESVSLAQEQAK